MVPKRGMNAVARATGRHRAVNFCGFWVRRDQSSGDHKRVDELGRDGAHAHGHDPQYIRCSLGHDGRRGGLRGPCDDYADHYYSHISDGL
jgi:hypothetical protein